MFDTRDQDVASEAVQAEFRALAKKYPARDSRGYVIGYYNVTPMGDGAKSGPHPTIAEAEEAKGSLGLGPINTICAHVFTSRGTIIRPD